MTGGEREAGTARFDGAPAARALPPSGAEAAVAPAAQFENAVRLADSGRHAEARGEFEACLAAIGAAAELEIAILDIQQRSGSLSARAVALRVAHDAEVSASVRARALHAVGLAEGKLRRSRDALRSLQAARDAYSALGDRVAAARVRDTIASLFAARGELDVALGQYALSLFEKTRLGDRAGAALTIGNMGRLHMRAERLVAALECFELDLEIARELGDLRGTCRMLYDIGRMRTRLGEFDAALVGLREALEIAKTGGWVELACLIRIDLALATLGSGDPAEALNLCDSTRVLLPEGADAFLHAVFLAARGEILLELGHEEAVKTLDRAANEFSLADAPDSEIPTLLLLARALVDRRRVQGAEVCLRRAQQRARTDGLSRYLPRIREAMKALTVVDGAVEERNALEFPRGRTDAAEIGGYALMHELGRGGYGRTWKALDAHRDQVVAVKQLELEGVYDVTTRRRLLASARTELEAASRLRHPGIARVFAIGETPSGSTYVVQEFVDGCTLRAWMREPEEVPIGTISGTITLIANALDALHDSGVIHRDLKPENVLVSKDGNRRRPVLIDFGIAQVPRRSGSVASEFIEGTLAYMSPEQIEGEPVDGTADVYALGVIAYEWLSRSRPVRFPAGVSSMEDAVAFLRRTRIEPLSSLRPDLHSEVCALVHGMLTPKRSRRPRAADVASAWSRWASSPDRAH